MEIANKIVKTDLIEWKNLEWLQGKLKAIPESSLKKLKQSLINNSFVQPFNVWENGKLWILDGHHRKLAMEQLEAEGYDIPDKLPANFIQCKDKKEASKMVLLYSSIYAKADEKSLDAFLTENGIDFSDVSGEIDLPELNLDTFGIDDIDDEKLDAVPEPQKDPISKLGDIFLIDGKHRVMCGDSTIKADVEALMAGKRADMVFTDIPYGIDYSGGRTQTVVKKEYGKIKGDAEQDISLFVGIVKENGYKRDAYMCVSPINLKPVFDTLDSYDGVIVWKKNSPGLGYQWIRRYCEFIIFTSNRKKTKRDDSEFDYWDIATDAKTEYVHGTQKPVKLPMRAINFSSVQDDLVADWFLGSGSTLIASQQTNRICYGMELDPIYIDVILRRYKNLYPDAEFECLNREFDFETLFGKN